ncbi:hypothetical protein [Murimonas intestini]|uniref:Uncharacterized protein n=1 Tax=Murimonas intestini TaxID=1337051 RepID=A0AB73T877_9FIRM|nr:hypothetical protein [Murimonas intestini]MCR1839659.1 hypothetical protein [Murimonas intestini]MCR1866502.1 hypothetical protein [Murimonas intestini]MCR1884874.1 hypothetical protein [Murimonas intestini]
MKGKVIVAALAAVLALGTCESTTEAAAADSLSTDSGQEYMGEGLSVADVYRDFQTGVEFNMFEWEQDEFGEDSSGYADYQKEFTCSDVTTDYILVMDSPGDSNALVAVAKGRGQMANVSRGYPGEIERIVSYIQATPVEQSGKQVSVGYVDTYAYEYLAYDEVDYFLNASIYSADLRDCMVVYRIRDAAGSVLGQGVTILANGEGQLNFYKKYPIGTPDPGMWVEISSTVDFSENVADQYSFSGLSFTKSDTESGKTYCRGSGSVVSADVGEESLLSVRKLSQSSDGTAESASYVVMKYGTGEVWTADVMTQPDEDPQYQFWVNGIIIPHDVLLSQEDVWK